MRFKSIIFAAVAALALVGSAFAETVPTALTFRRVLASTNYDSSYVSLNPASVRVDTTLALNIRQHDIWKHTSSTANTTAQGAGLKLIAYASLAFPGDSCLVAVDVSPDGVTWVQHADFANLSITASAKVGTLYLAADQDAAYSAAGGWVGFSYMRFRFKAPDHAGVAAVTGVRAQLVKY